MFNTYIDWTTEDVPRPFYVGKGNDGRARNPFRNSKHRWVRKHLGHRREIVFSSEDEKQCFEREIDLIKEHHTFHLDEQASDIACNFTIGGEGVSGWHHSEETKQKIGEASKGNTYNVGRKHTLETRQKLSSVLKNNPRVIAGQRNRKHSVETKTKISAAHLGKQKSESTRLKMQQYQNNKSEVHIQNLLNSRRNRSKLNEDKVRQIKRAWEEEKPEFIYGQSKAFCRRFALQFEVSVNAIYAIIKGRFWSEVK